MRRRVLAAVAALVLLAALIPAVASSAPQAVDCDSVFKPPMNSTAKLKAYIDCREDAQDAALKRIEDRLDSPEPSTTPTAPTSPSASASPSGTPSPTPSVSPSPSKTTESPAPTSTSTPSASATPSQSPSTTPTQTASPGGFVVLGRTFPDASTTGVPDHLKDELTPYTGSCTITTPNVKIDRKIVNCDGMRLLAPGIEITNSIINSTVYSDCCYLNGAFSITDSEVRGPAGPGTVVGEARFKLLRVEITGGTRSVNCNIDCEVRDSYIHGQWDDKSGTHHESGIRQDQGGVIVHNTITCDAKPYPPDSGCSAAISGYGDFGTVNNNRIENNLIDGGPAGTMSYCIYGGSTRGKPYPNAHHIVIKGNILRRGPSKKCGIYGPVADFDSKAEGSVWANNVYDDGVPVPPDR